MLHLFVPVNVLIPQVPFCYTSGYEYRTAISVDYTPPCDMGFGVVYSVHYVK